MTEQQRLFLVQARSDFAVFLLLRDRTDLPESHALHYLQMATELLGKAHAWAHGPNARTHRAFVGFLRGLTNNRIAQDRLGFRRRNQHWGQFIRKSVPLAERIEDLAPSLTPDGPNPEYPWPRNDPAHAPVEHTFQLWIDLQPPSQGHRFIQFVERLFTIADLFL